MLYQYMVVMIPDAKGIRICEDLESQILKKDKHFSVATLPLHITMKEGFLFDSDEEEKLHSIIRESFKKDTYDFQTHGVRLFETSLNIHVRIAPSMCFQHDFEAFIERLKPLNMTWSKFDGVHKKFLVTIGRLDELHFIDFPSEHRFSAGEIQLFRVHPVTGVLEIIHVHRETMKKKNHTGGFSPGFFLRFKKQTPG